MTPDDPRHGRGRAGYDAHRRDDEEACGPCRDAAARYQRGLDWDLMNGRRRMIPATGTLRRLRALVALGWTIPQIADAIGVHRNNLSKKILTYPPATVRASTAAKTIRLYDEWSMRLPDPTPYATRARNTATRYGWPPPLAWDDETIDDPTTVPAGRYQPATPPRANGSFIPATPDPVDEVAVRRILNGDWRLSCSKADKVAVVAAWDGPLNELARRTGWRVDRYVTREKGEVA